MNLGNRETAARRDAQLRGAEAFMAGELDDAHLLAEHRAACERIKELEAESERLRDLLADIYLYIDWRYITKQQTTEQKNLFADVVEMMAEGSHLVDRWWDA